MVLFERKTILALRGTAARAVISGLCGAGCFPYATRTRGYTADGVASLKHDVDSTVDRRPLTRVAGTRYRASSPVTDSPAVVFQGWRVAVCALRGYSASVARHVGPAVSVSGDCPGRQGGRSRHEPEEVK